MISKCQCSFRIRMVGDGCRCCQPQGYIDRLEESLAQEVFDGEVSQAEIALLKTELAEHKPCTAITQKASEK